MNPSTQTGPLTVLNLDGEPTESPTTGFVSDAPTTGSPTAGIPIVAEIVAGHAELEETPSAPSGLLAGALLVVGAAISIQIGAALAISLFPTFGPWGTTTLRLFFAGLVLLVITRPRVHQWNREQWLAVVTFGIVLGSMNGIFYMALDRIPLGIAVSVEFIGPLALAAVLSRRLADLAWVGFAVVGIGLFFLNSFTGAEALDWLGMVFVLIAGALWAGYIMASQRAGQLVSGAGGLAVAVVISAVISAPFGWRALPEAAADWRLLALAFATAMLATVVPYSLEFAALRRLPKSVFGILLSLEPVVAAISGTVLLGQGLSWLAILAIAVIVVASAGSTLSSSRHGPEAPRPVTGQIPVIRDDDIRDDPALA